MIKPTGNADIDRALESAFLRQAEPAWQPSILGACGLVAAGVFGFLVFVFAIPPAWWLFSMWAAWWGR